MRRPYRHRNRRSHRGVLALVLLLLMVFLVSCVAGSDPMWIKGVFGVDVAHYDQEPTLSVCDPHGETAVSLADTVASLTTANGLQLKTFRNATQAVDRYRDALLNDLLRSHYLLYTGNSTVLSSLPAVYAENSILTLIPEADFEQAAARYFGAITVRHRDGELFEHLGNADGYTAPLQAWEKCVEVSVETLEETEHTWRMTFRLCDGEEYSPLYRAIFIKRESGECYIDCLELCE